MRYEILTDTRYVSTGTIVSVVPDSVVIQSQERIEVNGPETLKLVVPSTLDAPFAGDRVVNVVEDNGAAREWRVGKLTRTRSNSGVTTTVDCQGIRSDLMRFSPIVTQQQANGDRWSHIEWVSLTSTELWEAVWNAFDDDADSVSYFSKGTCPSSTRLHDFVLDWETQGSALIELATVLGYEVDVQAGSTSYVVNLSTGINSTLTAPLLAFQRNQLSVRYVEDHSKTATRIYPRALGDNAFKPTIGDLAVRGGGTTGGVLDIGTYETDQLKGLYLELVGDSTRRLEITGSSTLTENQTTVTWSSAAGSAYFPALVPFSSALGAGKVYSFLRESSTGLRLVYIPRSTATSKLSSVVLDRQDIPAITNMLVGGVNPGSGDMPVFAVGGGGASVNEPGPSPFVHLGNRSGKITLPALGDSVTFAGWLVGGVSDERPHLSMQTNFYLESGRVGLRFTVHDEPGSFSIVFPQTTAGGSTLARATAISRWHDLAIAPGAFNYNDAITGSFNSRGFLIGDVTFKSITSTGTTVAYVDSIQVVNDAVPAEQIVDGSAARKLWNAGIEMLRGGIDRPAKLYDIDAIDLGRLSSGTYPGEAFQYGQNVTLFDPGIRITDGRRVKARTRDMKIDGVTKLELFDVG